MTGNPPQDYMQRKNTHPPIGEKYPPFPQKRQTERNWHSVQILLEKLNNQLVKMEKMDAGSPVKMMQRISNSL